jgi:tetratricopeptide (TPR) repeat protein
MSLAAAVGLSVLLFVGALLAGHLGKFRIQQSFEPHSPMMQTLLNRYQRAYTEFQNGQIDRALAEFRPLVASHENPQGLGYDGLAAAYFEAELIDRALELPDEALGRFPQHGMAHLLRGDILYTQGRTADALPAYREATSGVAVFPWQRAAAHTGIGVFYGLQNAWDRARAAFAEAIASDPSSPAAYVNLGYLARQEGKDDEAKQWFDKAYALKPTDEVTLYYRQLFQTSTKPPPGWNSRKGRLLIFPFVYVGGNLQRLGTGEMLASLVGEALVEDDRLAVFAGRDLKAVLQGSPLRSGDLSNLPAAINVAKIIGADFVVYGSHRHYTNILAVDATAVHVKTMKVLTNEHLKSHGTDKILAASQALAAKLRPVLADVVQQAIR